MTSLATPTSQQSLFTRLRFLNERAIFALGIGSFLLVLVISIALRLFLELRFGELSVVRSAPASKDRSLAKGDVLVPVTLSAKLIGGRVILRGTLPTEEAHQTVLARAQELYGARNIDDNLGVQPDIVVTPWFDSVLRWFPGRVVGLQNGEISVSGMNVFLFGEVSSIESRSAAHQTFAKLVGPEGHFSNSLQVRNSAESAVAAQSSVAGSANKDLNTVKPANFKVQF